MISNRLPALCPLHLCFDVFASVGTLRRFNYERSVNDQFNEISRPKMDFLHPHIKDVPRNLQNDSALRNRGFQMLPDQGDIPIVTVVPYSKNLLNLIRAESVPSLGTMPIERFGSGQW